MFELFFLDKTKTFSLFPLDIMVEHFFLYLFICWSVMCDLRIKYGDYKDEFLVRWYAHKNKRLREYQERYKNMLVIMNREKKKWLMN